MPLGRPKKEVPEEELLDLLVRGWTKKDAAQELGVTVPTLNQRIVDLQKKEGLILQYRALQSLELTSIQAQILENITPEKIATANLRDLVAAFKILKDKELVAEGRPTEIKGLVGYLMHLEKEDKSSHLGKTVQSLDAEIINRIEDGSTSVDEVSKLLEDEPDESSLDGLEDFSVPLEGDAARVSSKSIFPTEDLPDL